MGEFYRLTHEEDLNRRETAIKSTKHYNTKTPIRQETNGRFFADISTSVTGFSQDPLKIPL